MPDRFLRRREGGTDRTYAYVLVDHLRWLESEALTTETVAFPDLERYMAAVGAEYRGPVREALAGREAPLGAGHAVDGGGLPEGLLRVPGITGAGREVAEAFKAGRLPSRAGRQRMFLGHVVTELPANPLAPKRPLRRHPKMPPEGARKRLEEALAAARDRMTVTLAGRRGLPCRGAVRAAPGRPAPAGGSRVRGVPCPACPHLPPGGEPEPGQGQDQARVADRGRRRLRRADPPGEPGDDPRLLRVHDG
jgi:hypothetical protein